MLRQLFEYRNNLSRFTVNTTVDRVMLEKALVDVQKTGLSWDIEEHAEAICAIGTVFTNQIGRVFAAKRKVLALSVQTVAAQIAELMPS